MFGRLQLGAVRDHPRTTIELGVTDGFDALRHYERGRFRRAAQTPFLGATEGGRWRRDCRAILWSQGSRTGNCRLSARRDDPAPRHGDSWMGPPASFPRG